MANLKSSKKQAKKNIKRRNINLARKTTVKSSVKKVLEALVSGDIDQAQNLFNDAQSQLSRAKNKGLLHANNAARKIKRLSAKISKTKKKK